MMARVSSSVLPAMTATSFVFRRAFSDNSFKITSIQHFLPDYNFTKSGLRCL